MAQLRVRLRGKVVSEISLKEEKLYRAGRKEDCDILLQGEKGISREHFQMSFEQGQWKVMVLSKFGDVLWGGEKVQELILEDGHVFSVPPYEFELTSNEVLDHKPQTVPSVYVTNNSITHSSNNLPDVSEGTFVGNVQNLVPVLKILDEFQNVKNTIRLEGKDTFLAGREPTCQIFINDRRVSRSQFNIRQQDTAYFITDLGSVNGTYVNGQALTAQQPTQLNSGDTITVLDNQIIFELFDPQFQTLVDQVKSLAPVSPSTWATSMPAPYDPHAIQPYLAGGPVVAASGADARTKKIRIALGVMAILMVLGFLFKGGEDSSKPKRAPESSTDPLAKLDPEQKKTVRHHYQLAENYLAQQKWMLAKGEIEKIKQILPNYQSFERTKELESNAEQGLISENDLRRFEEGQLNEKLQEEKIQLQVSECRKRVRHDITKEEIENCLQPVLAFNPEHSAILQLRSHVDQIVTERGIKQERQKELARQAAQLRSMFESAENLEKKKIFLGAIRSYERVQGSGLPDRGGYKEKAQRQIVVLRNKIDAQTASLLSMAEKQGAEQQYKQAILSLRDAKRIDPANAGIDEKIETYTKELRKSMLVLFQEGILEEGFGNIEGSEGRPGAKDKWKKILELDISDGEYYKKARQRLKKYGGL